MPGQNTLGKVWDNAVGGFLGITDKYWAAAVIPDQAQAYQGAFTARQDPTGKAYQADVLGRSADGAARRHAPRRRSASSPAPRKSRSSISYEDATASRTSTC